MQRRPLELPRRGGGRTHAGGRAAAGGQVVSEAEGEGRRGLGGRRAGRRSRCLWRQAWHPWRRGARGSRACRGSRVHEGRAAALVCGVKLGTLGDEELKAVELAFFSRAHEGRLVAVASGVKVGTLGDEELEAVELAVGQPRS